MRLPPFTSLIFVFLDISPTAAREFSRPIAINLNAFEVENKQVTVRVWGPLRPALQGAIS